MSPSGPRGGALPRTGPSQASRPGSSTVLTGRHGLGTALGLGLAALVACARPAPPAARPAAPARVTTPPTRVTAGPPPTERLALGNGATLRVWQKGRWIASRGGALRLRAAPFALELQIPAGGPAIFLNASRYPTLSLQVAAGEPLERALPSYGRCYALSAQNPTCPLHGPAADRELFLSEEAYSCWFPFARSPYLPRYPSLPEAGRPTCRVPVDRLRDLSGGRNAAQGRVVPFTDLRGETLYLVFGTQPVGRRAQANVAPLRPSLLKLVFAPEGEGSR